MQHDVDVGVRPEDIGVEAPFRRRAAAHLGTVIIHLDNVVRCHHVIGQLRRRNEATVADAQREVSGDALIDAAGIHLSANVHHVLAPGEIAGLGNGTKVL